MQQIKHTFSNFQNCVFYYFPLWKSFIVISHPEIGFYTPKHPRGQVLRSVPVNVTSKTYFFKMFKVIFLDFLMFSPLEVISRHFGPKIRILHPKITPWVEF